MYLRHITGKEGEEIAEKYLKENKYKIIVKNFYCRQGEIDIIAKDKDETVFIEVKTRTSNRYGEPAEAVTKLKKKHMLKSIEYYLYINNLEDSFVRIDIIEVYKKENKYYVHHIKNAIYN